jgi:hypothetical protein
LEKSLILNKEAKEKRNKRVGDMIKQGIHARVFGAHKLSLGSIIHA